MNRVIGLLAGVLAVAALLGLAIPGVASASFGIASFDIGAVNGAGGSYAQAGGHPYEFTTHISWNSHEDAELGTPSPEADVADAVVDLPPGFVGNPTILPTCSVAQLLNVEQENTELSRPTGCPVSSQVGVITLGGLVTNGLGINGGTFPLYDMEAPTGRPARFGFLVAGTPVFLDASLREEDGTYALTVGSYGTPEALKFTSSDVTFWGVPSDPSHDVDRCNVGTFGFTLEEGCGKYPGEGGGEFPSDAPRVPFFRLATACPPTGSGQEWRLRTDAWRERGVFSTATVFSHEAPFYPEPPGPQQGPEGCDLVPFSPQLSASPSQQSASSPTGLQADLSMANEGLLNPTGIAQSDVKKAVVTLPEGMTINPSQADGLGVCTQAQYDAAALGNPSCPSTAKIGTAVVHTPLLEEAVEGSVYVAKPYENQFGSLLALYVILENSQRGIFLKLPGRVDLESASGQITTTFENLPQLPFSSFGLHLRAGARAPLVAPQACGSYTTVAKLYPWSNPEVPTISSSSFQITSGVGGGPCPSKGLPPFKPGLIAGSVNNAAKAYSPFDVRLFRTDEEQEITHFSIKLPPGLSAKLAGVPFCPDAAIEAAKTLTGAQELESPSCPAASEIGSTLVGAGVGSVLAYVPGKVYLAGPYHGAPISIAAITSAKVGPFDLGTVVVRQALKVDPATAEVFVDATGSDPLPHIIQGVATHLRDIRVYVDKPEFALNPTSCEPTSTAATVLGSGLDFVSEADDNPLTVSTRYQAADCAALGFKPKLALSLKGGTKRSQVPAFKAVLTPRAPDANLARAEVILPHSEFLEQGHIRTICTRVQFAEGGGNGEHCPAGSIYGRARAVTPILSEPLEGPVFLRSNGGERNVPDLVAALHGQEINIDLVGFIDSVHEKNKQGEVISRIRNRFEVVPDAPVTKFVLEMKGGKQGLLVNSTNLCRGVHRAEVHFTAHNGLARDFKPALATSCPKSSKRKHRKGKGR